MKKALSLMLSLTLVLPLYSSGKAFSTVNAERTNYNYGEALQKSLLFYELQRSGKLPADKRDNWRGDSGMSDGADNNIDLTGGWYDAGDNCKFNLPMSYSSTMLAWSVYESKAAYEKSGQLKYALDDIKWANDYFIKCHPSPDVYYYQVGKKGPDHSWWGPAECMQMERPSFKIDKANPGTSVASSTAASLAAAAIIFKESNPGYSATCLTHAKQLFDFADSTKSNAGYTASEDLYPSYNGFWDDLSWAGTWLYMATDDKDYLDKAEAYVDNWGTEPQSTTISYKWAQNWDDTHYGAQLLLARLTNKDRYKESVEKSLDWWSGVNKSDSIEYTPKGLAWLSEWGSLRYAATSAFLASVYADWKGCPENKVAIYKEFAKQQVDYALGSSGRSFMVNFGTNPPKHPHHRTAHSSWTDSLSNPSEHRHTLCGALVGGPGKDDSYTDSITDYTKNEVACDYNAGLTGALAKLYDVYGGDPLPNLNAVETKTNDEFYVEAGVNASSSNFVEIKALLHNESGWPARVTDKLSFKYFVDLSEIIKAGYSINDMKITTNYTQGCTVSKLIPLNAAKNLYYVLVDFSGTKIYPGGQSAYKKEVQFRIAAPDKATWDNSNDFSFKGVAPNSTPVKVQNIPVYDNGVKVYGNEPADITMNTGITYPKDSAYFESITAANPLVITADASASKGNAAKVEFFVNDVKIGESTSSPYKCSWYPTGYSQKQDGIEPYTLTAKATDGDGNSAMSSPVNITIKLPVKPKPVISTSITSPLDGQYFENVTAENPIVIKADASVSEGTISKVEFYANDTKLGQSSSNPYQYSWCPNIYTKNADGIEGINLTAKAFDGDNNSTVSKAVYIKVKLPVQPPVTGNLSLQAFSSNPAAQSNGIYPKLKLTNTGSTDIKLSEVKIRYYYTIDGEKPQNFWCDWCSAGTENVSGTFVKLGSPKETADYYVEIGFKDSAGTITPGQSVEICTRFAKSDWSNYLQSNDYSFNALASSYTNTDAITLYLSGILQSGREP